MRIDRRVRAKSPKPSGLWPAPPTAEQCQTAVHHATIKELVSARELIRSTPEAPDEKPFARFIAFDITNELRKRFREKLAGGLSQLELAKWAEVLEDPQFVQWMVSRKVARESEEKERPQVIKIRPNQGEQL
jgi:hypothetical protein